MPLPFPEAYEVVKQYLKHMLKDMLEYIENNPSELKNGIPVLQKLGPVRAAEGLKSQLEAFWRGEWPFSMELTEQDPLAWWEQVGCNPHADVLAVSVL